MPFQFTLWLQPERLPELRGAPGSHVPCALAGAVHAIQARPVMVKYHGDVWVVRSDAFHESCFSVPVGGVDCGSSTEQGLDIVDPTGLGRAAQSRAEV